MNKCRYRLIPLLLLCALLFPLSAPGEGETDEKAAIRLPEAAVFSEAEEARLRNWDGIQADPMLSMAFTLLETGNPFQARYNLITGEQVASRLAYGIPYFWGGRSENYVFGKEPDYVVLPAWQDSRVYYKANTEYLFGFDCVGFVAWVWQKTQGTELPNAAELLRIAGREIPELPAGTKLQIGDLLLMEHPGRHVAMYVGTLRMYGYTEEEVPELREELDSPLVMHSTVNASISDRFAYLMENGLPKYRRATVTDGGVCVSLLCESAEIAPHHVFQQKQDTWYFVLPDRTWLTVLPLEGAERACWIRLRSGKGK